MAILSIRHIQCLHLMYAEVTWEIVSSGTPVQPEIILHPNYPSRLPFRLLWLFLKLLLMFNMCQYLFINSFMFGRTGLYVTENGIEPLGSGLQCLKSNDLSRWSTLSICFLTIDSLQPFSKSSFQQALYSISSWECFLYSSKVEHMRLILSAWLYGILFLNRTGVPISHPDSFDRQLVFCRG